MSKFRLTPAQEDAVNAFGGSIIVSAAAGSGKTRVLVQRVIKLLTDPENPIDADRMLIVTFTKAAAEEMRSRIASAIEQKILSEPDNTLLRRQQVLLPSADICTIHSFCSRIIRENFYLLNINQDFRIASEGESDVMKHRVLSEIIEESYQKGEEGFLLLSQLLSSNKTDKNLEQSILEVYNSCIAHPFLSDHLAKVLAFYDPSIPVGKTIYAAVAMQKLSPSVDYMTELLSNAEDVIQNNQAFCTGTKTCGENKLQYLSAYLQKLKDAMKSGDWDSISHCVNSYESVSYRKPTGKKLPVTEEECAIVKDSFSGIEDVIQEKLIPIFGIDQQTYLQDTTLLYPAVQSLCEIICEFDERFFAAKTERGVLDFSDLEHLMLRLLTDQEDGKRRRSEFAVTLSSQYDQIMVDEYQDTNEIQEYIFRYVSKNETNLFVVGDIKQSIYRFREAKPELFKARREASQLYSREDPQFPAKIILDRNFRSRDGIIDSVNFVFHALMSEQVGEITYNEEEALTTGAVNYPEWDEPAAEFHLLDGYAISGNADEDDENEDGDKYVTEAKYIAELIQEKLRSGLMVTNGETQRKAVYSDFAVLMRYVSTHGQTYAEVLNACGIPAYIDKPYSLFGCYEVNILISLLKILDNPLQDIPVLGMLLSPVFGFTADDAAELKNELQGKYLYQKLRRKLKDAENTEDTLYRKCAYFYEVYEKLRTLSVTVSVYGVLDRFLDETGFLPIMSASENGSIKVRNIRKFLSFVQDYESSGKTSLTGFIRYLTYLEDNGTDISVADSAPVDAVRIMSIHHSKGLEFPVCILAGLSAKGSEDKEEILCQADLGFGLKTIDTKNLLKFNTLQRNVIRMCKDSEDMSEAMRVLYVALTRAKEKLITVIYQSSRNEEGLAKALSQYASKAQLKDGRISPYAVESCGSLADWMMLCAMIHPSMGELRRAAGREEIDTLPCKAKWSFRLVSALKNDCSVTIDENEENMVDETLLRLMEQRFAEKYPYQSRVDIPSKVSASALAHDEMMDYHIADSRPAFMQEDHMTGAEKGTAMHLFLQFADFGMLKQSPQEELQRLLSEGYLTEAQAAVIHESDLERFVGSSIFSHICSAERVLREHRFTVNIKASDIDESYPENEDVILQGAIDCLIIDKSGIIIVDYKTDRVKDPAELAVRYRTQLRLYRKAASQLFELPVKKCCIYSIHHAAEVEVET